MIQLEAAHDVMGHNFFSFVKRASAHASSSSVGEYLEWMVIQNNTPLINRIPLVLLMEAQPFIFSMYS